MIISIKEVKKFIICVLIPLLVGGLSGLISTLISSAYFSTDYLELAKPSFSPPGSVFAIVWPILYILMGISAYIVISSKKSSQKINDAMFYYYLQLGLNFLWSILFFGLNLRLVALIDLFILIVVVIIMMYKFYHIDKKAMLINIPYLLWLFFAFALNYYIWILNK